MNALKFKNFTGKSFTWKYDGIPYTFEAGQETYLEDYKAQHFAKHLVDEACNEAGIPTNDPKRKVFEAQCFPAAEAITPQEAIHVEAKKKAGRPKKVVEKEFEEINDEQS